MNRHIIYILITGIWLLSCEKEVKNIKLPNSDPKLVITGFISPQDTVIRVNVNKSVPVFGKPVPPEDLSGCLVELSDGTRTVGLAYTPKQTNIPDPYPFPYHFPTDDRSGADFTLKATGFPIQPGVTYFLKVSTPEGLQATSTCTVPPLQNYSLEWQIDTVRDVNAPPGYKNYELMMQWQDAPGTPNFYRIHADIIRMEIIDGQSYPYQQSAYWEERPFFTDSQKDGEKFTSDKGTIWSYRMVNQPSDGNTESDLYVYLLDTDKNYYDYHESLDKYEGDNPFAEPVLIYSNISGGLGIFAAYNRTTVAVDLK